MNSALEINHVHSGEYFTLYGVCTSLNRYSISVKTTLEAQIPIRQISRHGKSGAQGRPIIEYLCQKSKNLYNSKRHK